MKRTNIASVAIVREWNMQYCSHLFGVLFIGLVAVGSAHHERHRPGFCYLPADTGMCCAYVSMWYYNSATRVRDVHLRRLPRKRE
ncbi:hypothetical protein LSAT2_024852 [Lamellibrachia satsuma]|nr:hypothetical protein LSAT2_024852 [Lamellibrachia satsuma]